MLQCIGMYWVVLGVRYKASGFRKGKAIISIKGWIPTPSRQIEPAAGPDSAGGWAGAGKGGGSALTLPNESARCLKKKKTIFQKQVGHGCKNIKNLKEHEGTARKALQPFALSLAFCSRTVQSATQVCLPLQVEAFPTSEGSETFSRQPSAGKEKQWRTSRTQNSNLTGQKGYERPIYYTKITSNHSSQATWCSLVSCERPWKTWCFLVAQPNFHDCATKAPSVCGAISKVLSSRPRAVLVLDIVHLPSNER